MPVFTYMCMGVLKKGGVIEKQCMRKKIKRDKEEKKQEWEFEECNIAYSRGGIRKTMANKEGF